MPIFSRRTFLGAGVVAVAGGIGVAAQFVGDPRTRGRRAATHPISPAAASSVPPAPLLDEALAREHMLLTRLAHAATTTPALAATIAVLRLDHQAHAAALAAMTTGRVRPRTTASSGPSPDGPASGGGNTMTDRAELVRWEKTAAAAVFSDFDSATGTEAAVLASIYACEQTHVAWLA